MNKSTNQYMHQDRTPYKFTLLCARCACENAHGQERQGAPMHISGNETLPYRK